MATFFNYGVHLFVACTFVLAAIKADDEAEVKEFLRLKDDVFGPDKRELFRETIREKIEGLHRLLKTGKIPAEVQGMITFDYVNGLVNDCQPEETCDLKKDLAKVERLRHRKAFASSSYLKGYLGFCTSLVLRSCAKTVHERALEKLNVLDEQHWKALEEFALEADGEVGPKWHKGRLIRKRCEESEVKYHRIVLKALRELDPEASNKMAKRMTTKKKSLRMFMDRIREPCAIFLANLDPLVQVYPVQNNVYSFEGPFEQLTLWNFYRRHCKSVVDEWESIFKKAYEVYKEYLADPKSESNIWWGNH